MDKGTIFHRRRRSMIIIEMVTKMRRNDKKLWQNVAQEALGQLRVSLCRKCQ